MQSIFTLPLLIASMSIYANEDTSDSEKVTQQSSQTSPVEKSDSEFINDVKTSSLDDHTKQVQYYLHGIYMLEKHQYANAVADVAAQG